MVDAAASAGNGVAVVNDAGIRDNEVGKRGRCVNKFVKGFVLLPGRLGGGGSAFNGIRGEGAMADSG